MDFAWKIKGSNRFFERVAKFAGREKRNERTIRVIFNRYFRTRIWVSVDEMIFRGKIMFSMKSLHLRFKKIV